MLKRGVFPDDMYIESFQ